MQDQSHNSGNLPTHDFLTQGEKSGVGGLVSGNDLYQRAEGIVESVRYIADNAFDLGDFPVMAQAADTLEAGFHVLGDKAGFDVYDDGFMGKFAKLGDYAVLAKSAQDLKEVVDGVSEYADKVPGLSGVTAQLESVLGGVAEELGLPGISAFGPDAVQTAEVQPSVEPSLDNEAPAVVGVIGPKL